MKPMDEVIPLITVALCTHNHADRLAKTLADLAMVYPPDGAWELLVVDNASTDATSGILAASHWRPADVNVRIVREERLGISYARNRALQEARGEYLLFIDDDETPDSHWIRAYEQAIRDYNPDALGGRIEVQFEDGDPPAWLQDELLGFLGKLDHGPERWLTRIDTPIFTGNAAFRRSIFKHVGIFDTTLGRSGKLNTGGEDVDLYRRLVQNGFRIRWVPSAVISHRIQTTKLRRAYFLDLHYRQGWIEGARKRGQGSRIPPKYLWPQVVRAYIRAFARRFRKGSVHSLRLEMNASYFAGYVIGWICDRP